MSPPPGLWWASRERELEKWRFSSSKIMVKVTTQAKPPASFHAHCFPSRPTERAQVTQRVDSTVACTNDNMPVSHL